VSEPPTSNVRELAAVFRFVIRGVGRDAGTGGGHGTIEVQVVALDRVDAGGKDAEVVHCFG